MSVPKIYKDFYEQRVFTLTELKERYKKDNTPGSLNVLLHQAKMNGYIDSIKKGLYYIIPHGFSKPEYQVDKYLIAAKMSPSSVIGYHSALELLGVAQSVFNRVFVLTDQRISAWDFQGTRFIGVSGNPDFGQMTLTRDGVAARVTDRERTLIDCVDRLRYAGGLEEYLKSVDGFPSVNFERLEEYLQRYGKVSLYSKTGFILSFFEKKWLLPEDTRARLRKKIRKKVYYLDTAKKENTLNKEWNLMVPLNLKEFIYSS